jgi:hypothetical protein
MICKQLALVTGGYTPVIIGGRRIIGWKSTHSEFNQVKW